MRLEETKVMPDEKGMFREVLPKQGLVYQEEQPSVVICKPKLLPLKSVTLEKLEKMQKEAEEKVKEQEALAAMEEAADRWRNEGLEYHSHL